MAGRNNDWAGEGAFCLSAIPHEEDLDVGFVQKTPVGNVRNVSRTVQLGCRRPTISGRSIAVQECQFPPT